MKNNFYKKAFEMIMRSNVCAREEQKYSFTYVRETYLR